jgi:hypothetical protein
MTMAGEEATQQGGAQAGAEGAQQPQGGQPAAQPAKQEPAKPAAKAEGAQPASEPKRVRLKGDDEVPDDADLIEMSPRAFSARLGRMTSKQLKELFGTDDVDQIKKDREELQTRRQKDEADRQAQLSKEQKAEEARLKAERERDEAQNALRQERETRDYEKQDGRMVKLAGKYLDEDHIDVELTRFAKHLTTEFSRKELEKLTDKQVYAEAEKFFAERVKAKPKIGKDWEAQRSEELKAELSGKAKPKVAVTNGAGGTKPEGKEKNGGQPEVLGKKSKKEIKKAGYNW